MGDDDAGDAGDVDDRKRASKTPCLGKSSGHKAHALGRAPGMRPIFWEELREAFENNFIREELREELGRKNLLLPADS